MDNESICVWISIQATTEAYHKVMISELSNYFYIIFLLCIAHLNKQI